MSGDMIDIRSFRDVVELWPSIEAMASDVQENAPTIAKWRQRDSIPAGAWKSIVSTKRAKSAGVTPGKLMELAARKSSSGARA